MSDIFNKDYANLESLLGNHAKVLIFNPVGNESVVMKMKSIEIEKSNEAEDVTQFPANNKEYAYGVRDISVSGTCYFLNSIMTQCIDNSTLFRLQIFKNKNDVTPYFDDIFFSTKVSEKLKTATVGEFDLEFKLAPKRIVDNFTVKQRKARKDAK